jgi:STE24 endopeptidase
MNEDKATRYHRLKRRAHVAGLVTGGVLLVAFACSPANAALRDLVERLAASVAGGAPARWLAIALYVSALVVLAEAVALPLAGYRHFVERRYGLSAESAGQWLQTHLKAGVLGWLFSVGAGLVVFGAIDRWPSAWWLVTAAVFACVSALLAVAAPVLLFPLFYRFVPLARESLRERLLGLAARAGTRVLGIFEWRLGTRSRTANAALVGLGPTRRILLSDTLLHDYTDDEIEVILAHELAHHVHGDIRRALWLDAALTLVTLGLVHLVVSWAVPRMGLRGIGDLATLPVMLLAGAAVSLAATPWLNAMSRRHEWRADRYALDLTRNPDAFVSAMRRLGQQNLADAEPSRLVEWLFHTHPPLGQRIEAARDWSHPEATQAT